MRYRWLVLAAVLVAAACGRDSARGSAQPPTIVTVVIEGTRVRPDSLEINPGDSIVWLNKDPFPHTVTSAPAGLDSKDIPAGGVWMHTFVGVSSGNIAYACTHHPTMKGTVTVR